MIAALRTKARTDDEKAAKAGLMHAANRGAATVPLEVLEGCGRLLELAREAATSGNPNSLSDAGVAVWCARAAAEGAFYNVLINLAGLADDEEAGQVAARAADTIAEIRGAADDLAEIIEQRLQTSAQR